jgi:hypothetical protein
MKQFTRAVVSAALGAALSLACTLPAYAAEGEMLEVNEDISVSADYDWTPCHPAIYQRFSPTAARYRRVLSPMGTSL